MPRKMSSTVVAGILAPLILDTCGIMLKPVDEHGRPYKILTEEDYYVDEDGNRKVKPVDYSVEEYDDSMHRYYIDNSVTSSDRIKPVDYRTKESDPAKTRATKQVMAKIRGQGSVEEIKALMRDPHFDINYKYHAVYSGVYSEHTLILMTPLQYACQIRKIDIARSFLEFRIDNIDSRNLGIVLGRDGMSKCRRHIFPNKKRAGRVTPAMNVLHQDPFVGIVFKFLRRPLLDLNVADSCGQNCLHWIFARCSNQDHLVNHAKFLLTGDCRNFEEKFDINSQDHRGRTPLHALVYHGYIVNKTLDFAQLLITCDGANSKEKIDVNLQDDQYGFTPLQAAIYCGKAEIAQSLVSHHGDNFKSKLDISIRDKKGMTCLHRALQRNGLGKDVDQLIVQHHLSVSISHDKSTATIGNNYSNPVQTKVCKIDFAESTYPINKNRPHVTNAWGMMVAPTEFQEVVVHLLHPDGLAERSGLEKEDEIHALFVDGEQKWTSDRLVAELCRISKRNLRWAVERFDAGFSRFMGFIREACIEKQKIEFVFIPKDVFNGRVEQMFAKAISWKPPEGHDDSFESSSVEIAPIIPTMTIAVEDTTTLQEIQDAVQLPLDIVSKIYLQVQKSKVLCIERCLSGFSHSRFPFARFRKGQAVELVHMDSPAMDSLIGTIYGLHPTMPETYRVQLNLGEQIDRLSDSLKRVLAAQNFIAVAAEWRIKLIE